MREVRRYRPPDRTFPPLARNGTRAGRDLPLPFCSRFDLSIEDAPVASVQILIEAPKGWGAIAMH